MEIEGTKYLIEWKMEDKVKLSDISGQSERNENAVYSSRLFGCSEYLEAL